MGYVVPFLLVPFAFNGRLLTRLLLSPTDDETNMKELEANMRTIEMDGLVWGASKLVPVGYGISKLQVNLVVEDEKVSIDDLQAQIESDEDHVQSTDVVCSDPPPVKPMHREC